MEKCWARQFGDCSNKISREHTITAGIFIDPKVRVEGFSWCRDEPKEIGLANLTSKVLCTKHNSQLSEVDGGGIQAVEKFRRERELNAAREKMTPRRWSIAEFTVDGILLERWLTKCLINVAFENEIKIGLDSEEMGQPSKSLVEIVFGMRPFPGKAGLYAISQINQTHNVVDGIQIITLLNEMQILVGSIFLMHGYRFFLFFDERGLPVDLPLPHIAGVLGEANRNYKTVYHVGAYRFLVGEHLSHRVRFNWKSRNCGTPR